MRSGGPFLKRILLLASLTGLYFVTGKLSLALATVHANASPVWPATGIALAAVLLFGARVWPAVFVGALFVNLSTAGSVGTSLGIATGNTLEALIGALLARRLAGGAEALQRPQTVLRFALVVALAATVSATIGLLSLLAGGYAESARAASIWFTWWIGDATGGIAVAPLLLAWARPRRQSAPSGSPVEAIALGLVTVGITGVVWSQGDPLAYWIIPPLVWAAVRFGTRGAATTSFLVATLALWGTIQGLGPFGTGDENRSLLILLAFIAIAMTTSLVLAAAVRERERVESALRQSRDGLEEQVRARTASLADAVQDLEHSRSTLNDAQRVAHVGSWEWNVLANRVSWSDELYRIYGLEPGSVEVTFQAYLARVHPEDREGASASVRAALESGQEFAFEERIVRPDGEVRVLQSRGYVVRDGSGLPQRMIGTCHDITARKRDELELERRMEALNRTNAELSMLSYAASHDLREPLRTVASNVQLIERQLRGEAPEVARSARFAVEGVRRMEDLITDLLEYSNADRPSRGATDAERALAEARERLATVIQETGARIESGALPRVAAGPARLVGLFQNLISNSIKYRADGRGPEVRITAERDGRSMWRFDVADNGRGFDPADAERVFTIFERLDADHGIPGTGLGLAICRRTVEAQGGRIWAESERGRGSVFHFTLPIAPDGSVPA